MILKLIILVILLILFFIFYLLWWLFGHHKPFHGDHWAVIVAGSKDYWNYRH